MKRSWGVLVVALLALMSLSVPAAASTRSDVFCRGNAAGFPGKWGAVSKSCSFTSPPQWRGYLEVTWFVEAGTQQRGCVEGRMASVREQRPWQSLGCGKGGLGRVDWPANTLSLLEIRVKSYNVGLALVTYEI
ncbi:hypothetical protein QRX60_33940 [Amycolatopsis mongoliensis]|uniref:Secreted protein n=1 Tax=Amycolatopsis mongoliensis TaxID=715475 RepID=A0A9Y2JJ72_9PSEU|nr:hypothetical protein [Amycolatopsis sp. 4-36]WIX99032.1 hypothetical protein QRX60_33940 [Amycolatopsis sp. 4-36]